MQKPKVVYDSQAADRASIAVQDLLSFAINYCFLSCKVLIQYLILIFSVRANVTSAIFSGI